MKKNTKLQENKELLKFFKSVKKEFKNVPRVDVDGEVRGTKYNGVCAFLSDNCEDFFKQNFESQYEKVEDAIRARLDRINSRKKYRGDNEYGDFVWFPTNEVRLQFIDSQITRFQKMVDKAK